MNVPSLYQPQPENQPAQAFAGSELDGLHGLLTKRPEERTMHASQNLAGSESRARLTRMVSSGSIASQKRSDSTTSLSASLRACSPRLCA